MQTVVVVVVGKSMANPVELSIAYRLKPHSSGTGEMAFEVGVL